ncbi:Bug family tripartite tricarboxylate transporter substrate binding protein [Rhodoferax sediminis]|uniref:Tripartite tricarboxylate transporter substrate binding protein n=1 Tax=Rhodoferax sediminis TaxID=2509614 RepID=A0A515DE42_9BURK|nr:tripartite tricarboxylate transporter substrate binding protein [Rhodoferax sediminis]QDL38691.1 tripartite tricarboxylate transporter substrate binding protein [Rhodoferax sediminis]
MSTSHTRSTLATTDRDTRLSRRNLLGLGIAAGFAPGLALAQEFPSKPIRLMVGATPGGSIDFGARTMSAPLSELLHNPVLVENKPGAFGVLCTQYVIKSAPDGYTLLVGTPSPVIIAPQAMQKAPFNPLTDLTAINMVSTSPIAIAVNPRLEVKNLKELVALSRKRPITMGLPLAGSLSHLVVEMTRKATGINFLNVPYKGAAPAIADCIGGTIDATVSDVGVFLPYHRAGQLRVVMVTSEKRIDALPDVPTAEEYSPGLVVTNWVGIFGPAKMPNAVVEKINAALLKVVARRDVQEQYVKFSATASAMADPDAFQKFVASEYQRFGQIVRERNIVIGG